MSEVRNNFVKRDLELEQSLVKKQKSIPVDSTKPDTTQALSVQPANTSANIPEIVVIPEEPAYTTVKGTETIPVTVETTVAASTTEPEPPTSTPSGGTSGSTGDSGSIGGYGTDGLTEEERQMLISILAANTDTILTDKTEGELNSIIQSQTRGSNDSPLKGIIDLYNKLTTVSIRNAGTLHWGLGGGSKGGSITVKWTLPN